MNFLQLLFRTESRKFLTSMSGRAITWAIRFPAWVCVFAWLAYWTAGTVSGKNTTQQTWTFFLLAVLLFFLKSQFGRGYVHGWKERILEKLTADVSGPTDPDEESSSAPAPAPKNKVGLAEKLLSFVDPVRAAFNEFGFDHDSREYRFLKRLEDEWFYLALQSGLTTELRPDQYQYYMARYQSRSKFFSDRGFDDSTRSENLIAPSIVVGIERLAFGIRLEVELAPGLYYGPTIGSRQSMINAQNLEADVGRLVPDFGLKLEKLTLEKVPSSQNIYVDIQFTNLLMQIVSLTIPTPDSLSCKDDIFLGILEDGMPALHNLRDNVHIITQGATKSGKSAFTQGMLLQISCMTDVTICGIDPHSVLFNPAFEGTRHEQYMVHGSTKEDLTRYMELMENLYQEMIDRLKNLPSMNVPEMKNFTSDNPLLYILIDEFPGIEKNLKNQLGASVANRFTTLISQFLAEGRKVGFRVHVIMQQANAQNLSTQDRGNISTRITFRVDENISALMLHPEGVNASDMIDFIPGMGFYQAPRGASSEVQSCLLRERT